ncbi:MAG: metal-dependent hydrolase [Candidatus Dasytiphilus stammeri]
MTAKGHLIFAMAMAIFAKRAHLTPVITHGDWWHIIPSALLTSLLPDLDHPHSTLGRRLKWLSYPLRYFFGHRGFTHSILVVAVSIAIFHQAVTINLQYLLPADVLHGMIIGYISHLIADFITPYGIPLLWPWRRRFRLPLIKFQKVKNSERLFCLAFTGIAIIMPLSSSFYLSVANINMHCFFKILYILQRLLHYF